MNEEDYDDEHTGQIESRDGFVCGTCHKKFGTENEILAHQGNPVIYTQVQMDEARSDERAKADMQARKDVFLAVNELFKLAEDTVWLDCYTTFYEALQSLAQRMGLQIDTEGKGTLLKVD